MGLEREIKNLEFKVDTCFKFLRSYYRNRLAEAKFKLQEQSTKSTNLDLCYKHRQEQNHSHYSEHNCHYCKLLGKYEALLGKHLAKKEQSDVKT